MYLTNEWTSQNLLQISRFFHLNDEETFKRNNRKYLLSSKPKERVHSVVVLHSPPPPPNLIFYKTNVHIGGKENSLVSACLFCRDSYRHTALLLITLLFPPREMLRGIGQLRRILLSFKG